MITRIAPFRRIISVVLTVALLGISLFGAAMPVSAETFGFTNPITGTVQGSGYDENAGHMGIDLYPYSYGDPIYAAASGTITYSCEKNHTKAIQPNDDCCSVKILLDEPFTYNGYTYVSAFYTHMSDLVYDVYCGFNSNCIADYNSGLRENALESGSIHVEAGDLIGYAGRGNGATHLHFSFETGEDANYRMMPNSEYYEVFGWSYNGSITANEVNTSNDFNVSSTVQSKGMTLSQLKSKFPHGSYWNHQGSNTNNPDGVTNTPCSSHNNCNYYGTCSCNSFSNAIQCYGFALKLGYDAYGTNPRNWEKVYNLNNIKPGDIINYDGNNPGHTVFVIGVSGDVVTFAECNWGGRCLIKWGRSLRKSEFNNLYNVYVAPYALTGGQESVDACSCSTSYAGQYICTTSTYPLTIRSGHGINFTAIGSIPSGATVTVTKANGSWAHVQYNGVSGYASMEYLAKKQDSIKTYPLPFKCYPLSTNQHAANAYDAPNGNQIGYIYSSDYCTIKEIYANGWCLVNCPWESSTKDVYTDIRSFLNTSVTPIPHTAESKITTYIRVSGSSTLGWIDSGDQILIVDNTQSGRTQVMYPHSDGVYRCAWVDSNTLVHKHTPGPAATCTTPQVCTSCDAMIAPALGHNAGPAATCTSPQTCTRCGSVLNNILDHTPGAPETCTTDQVCTVCGTVLNKATGHNYNAGSYTEPTHPHRIYNLCSCGAKQDTGRTDKVANCSECYPAPIISGITYNPTNIKVNDTVTFTLNATGATTYQIVIGDGTNVLKRSEITANNTLSYTFTSEGEYSIWGSAYNGEIKADTPSVHIVVSSDIVEVTAITLNKNNASVDIGEKLILTAKITPENATNKSVTWKSSDTSVATVVNGEVTGINAGTCIISATSVDGGYVASCEVEVVDNSIDIDNPNHINIEIGSTSAQAGETAIVDVYVVENSGINYMQLMLDYDTTYMTLEKVVYGNSFGTAASSGAYYSWSNQSGDYTDTGLLMQLYFTVSEDAIEGTNYIRLTKGNGGINNYAEEDVALTVINGTVNVVSGKPGDVNSDQNFDGKDVTRYLRWLNGEEIDVNENAIDSNGDSATNGKDSTRLLRVLNGEKLALYYGGLPYNIDGTPFIEQASAFRTFINSANEIAINLNSIEANAGDEIQVVATITENDGVNYMQLVLDYNDTYLTLKDVQYGVLGGASVNGNNYAWSNSTGDFTNVGTLATFTFSVSESIPVGDYVDAVELVAGIGGVNNYNEEDVTLVVQNCKLTILPCNHSMIYTVGKDATCISTGIIENWYCSICEKTFADADGTTELMTTIIPVDPSAHTGGEATCKAQAICEVCQQPYGDLNPNNHKGETEIRNVIAATCKNNGYTGDTYCLDCDMKIADGKEIPATGEHVDADGDWEYDGSNHWHTCGCGTVFDSAAHTGGEATCKTQAICEVCQQSYGDLNENHHVNTEIRGYIAATEDAEGYTGDVYCNDCGLLVEIGETIPKLDHVHTPNSDWSYDTAYHWHKCTDCGERVDLSAHTATDWIIDKPATADSVGQMHKQCSVCGYLLESLEIPVVEEDDDIDWSWILLDLMRREFTITANANEGGTITNEGELTVRFDSSATYEIVPDEGYYIDAVIVDGNDIGAVSTYTFDGINSNHTIEAVFAKMEWENPYNDVAKDDWFYDAVKYVTENDLMNGMGNDMFMPYATSERAMIVTILWRLEGMPVAENAIGFSDVHNSDWYYDAVMWASENKIVEGYGDTTFRPDTPITHEQLAAILYRYAVYKGYNTTAREVLTDNIIISDWATDAVEWANAVKLLDLFQLKEYLPREVVARCQMAYILMQFCALYVE